MGRQAQAKVHTTPDGQAPQGWAEGGFHASILFAGGSGLGRLSAGAGSSSPRRSPSLPTSREATLAWGGFGVGLGQDPTDSGARVTAEEKNILPASPSRDLSTLLAAFWTLWEAEAASPTVFLNGGGACLVYLPRLGP